MRKWTLLNIIFMGVMTLPHLVLGQTLEADIHMKGVKGTATFQFNGNSLSATISLTQGTDHFPGSTVVELMPVWVYYDVEDKCADDMLGTTPLITRTVTGFPTTVNFGNVIDPGSLEGHSLRMTSSSSTVCATIQKQGDYRTAVAEFREGLYGTVHFRQYQDSDDLPTRIVSSLHSDIDQWNTTKWAVISSMTGCNDFQNVYNPLNVSGNECLQSDMSGCPIGDLSSKLGDVTIEQLSSHAKHGFTDTNLPLSGSNGIVNKVLMVYNEDSADIHNFCAEIILYQGLSATVMFSEDGISGTIKFSQQSPLDHTVTAVDLNGLQQLAGGYHVHKYPRPVDIITDMRPCSGDHVSGHLNPYGIDVNVNYPDPTASTDDMYETGDLSSKYGKLNNEEEKKGNYHDWNLPLYGSNGIVGRSLVIHKNDDTASRWICANIEPDYDVQAAIAKFRYPVIGNIIFTQEANRPESETTIFAKLDHLYGGSPSWNSWRINTNNIDDDMLLDDTQMRCQSTQPIYNPSNKWSDLSTDEYNEFCSSNTPLPCKLGDLVGRHGKIQIRTTGSIENDAENFFTDSLLPLSGSHSIIGKSLVIMNETDNSILACADIVPLHGPILEAKFLDPSVHGAVLFSQKPGYGLRMTHVTNSLTVTNKQYRLSIHEPGESITASSLSCMTLGSLYNPLEKLTSSQNMSLMDYPIGDLSYFDPDSSNWTSNNVPLSGVTSILGHVLVVKDQSMNVISCARLVAFTNGSKLGISQLAQVRMQGAVSGTALMYQMLYRDGTMGDTFIDMHFSSTDETTTLYHNWHVHQDPIHGDATSDSGRCQSAAGHYDPFNTIADETVYGEECKKTQPLHCEVGDESNKLGTYDLMPSGGRKVFVDTDLPLAGQYSAMGRSMVIHAQDYGAPRLACGDVIPVSGKPVTVEFILPSNLDKRKAAETYANAIGIPPRDVTVEVYDIVHQTVKARVHFSGLQGDISSARFRFYISDESRRESLGDYKPLNGPGGNRASRVVQASVLLMMLSTLMLLMG